ncbi:MAG: hypothetical protein HKN09_02525 [Saprospiraceae bacterium]|nr:hypothetical protein [Saprospiraceae bacterium]
MQFFDYGQMEVFINKESGSCLEAIPVDKDLKKRFEAELVFRAQGGHVIFDVISFFSYAQEY